MCCTSSRPSAGCQRSLSSAFPKTLTLRYHKLNNDAAKSYKDNEGLMRCRKALSDTNMTWHSCFSVKFGVGGCWPLLWWNIEVGEKGKHKKNPHTTKAPLLRDDLQYFVEKWHKISTCIVSVRDTWCADFLLFSFAFLYILHLKICFRMCTGLTLFLLRPGSPWFTSLWKAQVT